ncbi:MAG: rRNA adenine N-6-methyltransferase family protein [Patescibacteria group bacterium]
MNLTNIATIKNLCQEFGIRPSKKLGQNFLVNENILNKIISASELKRNDVILEIGMNQIFLVM